MRACKRCGGSGKEPDWGVLGAVIRERREKRGMTLRELARRAEVSPSFVSDMEGGRRGGGLSGPGTRRVLRIVGVKVDDAKAIAGTA